MGSSRVIYHNWLAEQGAGPERAQPYYMSSVQEEATERQEASLSLVQSAVAEAVESLEEQERYLVIRLYFLGQTIRQISAETNRAEYKLQSLHWCAIRKLKKSLASFVNNRYRVSLETHPECPICSSPHRVEIDALLRDRDRSRSLKPIISDLKKRYLITVKTPQILIGHEKYHQ